MSGTGELIVPGSSWRKEVSECTAPLPNRVWLTSASKTGPEGYNDYQLQSIWTSSDDLDRLTDSKYFRHQRVRRLSNRRSVAGDYYADAKLMFYPQQKEQIQKRFEQLSFDSSTDDESEGSDILRLAQNDFEPSPSYAASDSSFSSSLITQDEESTEMYPKDITAALPRVIATRNGYQEANIKLSRDSIPTATFDVTVRPMSGQRAFGISRRDRRRRILKAKVQHLHDRTARSGSMLASVNVAANAGGSSIIYSEEVKPKRKHCAFVQEQELECLFEDRVGTPHVSELQPGDDVNAQPNVDELSVGGSVAAFSSGGHGASGPSIFEVTDIPSEGLGIR